MSKLNIANVPSNSPQLTESTPAQLAAKPLPAADDAPAATTTLTETNPQLAQIKPQHFRSNAMTMQDQSELSALFQEANDTSSDEAIARALQSEFDAEHAQILNDRELALSLAPGKSTQEAVGIQAQLLAQFSAGKDVNAGQSSTPHPFLQRLDSILSETGIQMKPAETRIVSSILARVEKFGPIPASSHQDLAAAVIESVLDYRELKQQSVQPSADRPQPQLQTKAEARPQEQASEPTPSSTPVRRDSLVSRVFSQCLKDEALKKGYNPSTADLKLLDKMLDRFDPTGQLKHNSIELSQLAEACVEDLIELRKSSDPEQAPAPDELWDPKAWERDGKLLDEVPNGNHSSLNDAQPDPLIAKETLGGPTIADAVEQEDIDPPSIDPKPSVTRNESPALKQRLEGKRKSLEQQFYSTIFPASAGNQPSKIKELLAASQHAITKGDLEEAQSYLAKAEQTLQANSPN